MSIENVCCPKCNKEFRIKFVLVPKTILCPACKARFATPEAIRNRDQNQKVRDKKHPQLTLALEETDNRFNRRITVRATVPMSARCRTCGTDYQYTVTREATSGSRDLAVKKLQKLISESVAAPCPKCDPQGAARALFSESFKNTDRISMVASIIAVGVLLLSNPLMFDWIDPLLRILLSTFGGVLAFCLYYRDRRFWYMGILPGIFAGPTLLYASLAYISHACSYRDIYNIEIILVFGFVGLLFWCLWYYPLRFVATWKIRNEFIRRYAIWDPTRPPPCL
ncbi:MAG: hypothetical protein ACOX5G_12285 [Kiritimatiellia bacterium]